MMKEIVSINNSADGVYQDEMVMQAMAERVHGNLNRLYEREAYIYCHEPGNLKVNFSSSFSFTVKEGKVNRMLLDFVIDEANKERLEIFRFICSGVFSLDNFRTGSIDKYQKGLVYFEANDLFSMAYLMHALESASIGLDSVFDVVDDSMPKIPIEEYNLINEDNWEDSEDIVFDEHHVAYSKDGKILLFARSDFHETTYNVPDGVAYILDYAFLCCWQNIVLSIPRSVEKIGESIFGDAGGIITIRKE